MKFRIYCTLFIFIILFHILHTPPLLGKTREDYEKNGTAVWEGYTEERIVALTFDDGPHPKYTPAILDILNEYQAKGTFYVLGEHAQEYPGIVFRQFMDGHEIGNHTFSHSTNESKLNQEIIATSKIIKQITGQAPMTFRPVGGRYNENVVNISTANELLMVMWSWDQDTEDWKDTTTYQDIINHVIGNISPGDIILFHDAGGNQEDTVQALPRILEYLQKNNYTTVTVSELIERTTFHPK